MLIQIPKGFPTQPGHLCLWLASALPLFYTRAWFVLVVRFWGTLINSVIRVTVYVVKDYKRGKG